MINSRYPLKFKMSSCIRIIIGKKPIHFLPTMQCNISGFQCPILGRVPLLCQLRGFCRQIVKTGPNGVSTQKGATFSLCSIGDGCHPFKIKMLTRFWIIIWQIPPYLFFAFGDNIHRLQITIQGRMPLLCQFRDFCCQVIKACPNRLSTQKGATIPLGSVGNDFTPLEVKMLARFWIIIRKIPVNFVITIGSNIRRLQITIHSRMPLLCQLRGFCRQIIKSGPNSPSAQERTTTPFGSMSDCRHPFKNKMFSCFWIIIWQIPPHLFTAIGTNIRRLQITIFCWMPLFCQFRISFCQSLSFFQKSIPPIRASTTTLTFVLWFFCITSLSEVTSLTRCVRLST